MPCNSSCYRSKHLASKERIKMSRFTLKMGKFNNAV